MLEEVRKSVENHDIKGLRYIFADCLDVDPTFEKYKEDYEYCKSISGMFDKHQELSGISKDQNKWTTTYWQQLKLDLMKNFSQKRFEHMIGVAKVVYADKVARLLNERKAVQQKVTTPIVPLQPQKPSVGTLKTKAQQDEEIARERRKLIEANDLAAAEEAKQNDRIAKIREQEAKKKANQQQMNRQAEQNGGSGSKKAPGVVLIAVVIVVILLIILLL